MPRTATGQVVRRTNGTWALRFRAYGTRHYQTLGTAEEGWSQVKAEQALRHVMADVERGAWRPPTPEPVTNVNPDPGFHRFASEWFEATKGEWQAKTRLDYEWQLAHHLLPFFRKHTLSQITVREIDRYRQEKVAEGQAIRAATALASRSSTSTWTSVAASADDPDVPFPPQASTRPSPDWGRFSRSQRSTD
jgi:hypothetical protein